MTELAINGRQRTFTMQLPSAAQHNPPLALVLHGNSPTASGRTMREWTTFDQQAEAWGIAVAYPDGQGGCWADGRGVTTADEAGVDDVAFLRAIIDWAADNHGTSPDRAVVVGMSNGACMAHRLALEAADRIAVMAAVAGTMPESLHAVEPTHAVSALLIHGDADPIADINGGYSRHRGPNGELRGRTISLKETADRWRTINECAPPMARTTEFSSRTTSTNGIGGTQVAAWTLVDAGHTWPGTPVPPEWNAKVSMEFDAAKEICHFAHPLLIPAKARRRPSH